MASPSGSGTSGPTLDLEKLIQSLPACKRCRDCRRGCDLALPKCRYIAELIDHVRRLTPQSGASPATSIATTQTSASSFRMKTESAVSDAHLHYEHYYADAGGSYRYLGSESCLLISPRLEPRHVRPLIKSEEDEFEGNLSWKKSAAKEWELLELYLESIQPVYPILDLSLPSGRYVSQDIPADLTPVEIFTLNMIYSISCYILPNTGNRHDPEHTWAPSGRLSYHQANSIKYRMLADDYYAKAMEHLETATVEPNMETLQAVLLLAIHSSFDPKSGNFGQQIALAARLAFDLKAKGDLQELPPNEVEVLWHMHMTIFSLENQDTDLCFDKTKPAEYQCSLFRLQNRYRKGDYLTKQQVKKFLPPLDEKAELLPIVRISLHMTHLLLNPCWGSAWHVLEAVVSLGGIHVFVTPHWVYRAGTVLIQNIPSIFGGNLIQLYSNALLVLELSSWKWPSSATLSASLADLMQHMKIKYRPDWSDKLQQGDVRI
ncbi:hypothetical protein EK21DRAFT_102905 [Setomelanomma holmii]|uniref:Uncharacterized protein n=1 Tax=Setomelanomma holmii TaxID=210430 RepID=A0A9P4H2A4_9PLEO|nr:hypothetical protein EK21DRAFT_102905 [Setomelanomma holmii]